MKNTIHITLLFTLVTACINNDYSEFYWMPNEVKVDVEPDTIHLKDYPSWIDSLPKNI